MYLCAAYQLLDRNPETRLGTPRNMEALKTHPWFATLGVTWDEVAEKKLVPLFVPDKDKVRHICDLGRFFIIGSAAAAPPFFSFLMA